MSKENLKQLLLKCQVYMQEENFDALIQTLENIPAIENMSLEEAKECLAILNHLLSQAEGKRNQIAQTLVNIRKFMDSI